MEKVSTYEMVHRRLVSENQTVSVIIARIKNDVFPRNSMTRFWHRVNPMKDRKMFM